MPRSDGGRWPSEVRISSTPLQCFSGATLTLLDDRQDYGEARFQTYGLLAGRLVVVWTPRGADRHVISMRKCNAREETRYAARLGRSG